MRNDRLDDLIAGFIEGSLTLQERGELLALAQSDPGIAGRLERAIDSVSILKLALQKEDEFIQALLEKYKDQGTEESGALSRKIIDRLKARGAARREPSSPSRSLGRRKVPARPTPRRFFSYDRLSFALVAAMLLALGLWLVLTAEETPQNGVGKGAVSDDKKQAVPKEEEPIDFAALDGIEGEVFVVTDTGRRPAVQGERLRTGEGLEVPKAEGRAHVKFADGTRLELVTGVVRKFTDRRGWEELGKSFELARGVLLAKVTVQSKDQKMVITTPHAEMWVSDCRLRLVVERGPDGNTRLEVIEGRVRLGRGEQAPSLDVRGDTFVVVAEGIELEARPLTGNLLTDPGFENGGALWRSGDDVPGGNPEDRRRVRTGSRALHLRGNGRSGQVNYQVVPIVAGNTYEITVWKSDGTEEEAGANITWHGAAGRDMIGDESNLPYAGEAEGWIRLSKRFIAPADATYVRIHLFCGPDATSGVWFDDVSLKKVAP